MPLIGQRTLFRPCHSSGGRAFSYRGRGVRGLSVEELRFVGSKCVKLRIVELRFVERRVVEVRVDELLSRTGIMRNMSLVEVRHLTERIQIKRKDAVYRKCIRKSLGEGDRDNED